MSSGETRLEKGSKNIVKPEKVDVCSSTNAMISKVDFIPALLIILTLGCEWIPEGSAGDPMAPQWVYLTAITFCSSLFLFFQKDNALKDAFNRIKSSFTGTSLLLFILVCFISISWAYNKTESIFTLTFYVVSMINFFNLGTMLYCRPRLLKVIAYFVIALLVTEDIYLFSKLGQKIGILQIDHISNSLIWTAGNKNFFAASMMVKLPFIFYLLYIGNTLTRIIISPLLAIFAFAIVLLASRESQLNFIFQSLLICFFILFTTFKNKTWKWGLQLSGFFLVPFVLGILFANLIISEAKSQGMSLGMTASIDERISTIGMSEKESSFRIQQWSSALDFIKKNPIKGAGIGNWKIYCLPYETYSTDFYSSKFVHNDFLQMFAATGIVGGSLYFIFFALLVIYALRLFFKSYFSNDNETNILSLILGLVLISYMIDAFFSFPQERPVMQMYLALSAGWITAIYVCRNKNSAFTKGPSAKMLMTIFIILLLPCFWLSSRIYASAKQQSIYIFDFTKTQPDKNWSPETDEFPSSPNLAITSVPIDLIKSRYLIKAGRYNEAAEYIQRAKEANPNTALIPFFSSLLNYYSGNNDSAIAHALVSLQYRPRIKNNLNLVHMILSKQADEQKLHKGYEDALKIKNDEYLYAGYINILKVRKADSNQTRKVIQHAVQDHPNSFTIQFEAANYEYDFGSFDSSFSHCVRMTELMPSNGGAWQNMGLIRFRQKKYSEAVKYFDKAIELHVQGGVSELLKGRSIGEMGNMQEACGWFQKAIELGNQEAKGFQQQFCGN